jgi:sulfate adenylyltransferase large subunit
MVADGQSSADALDTLLQRDQSRDLLRVITAGSVDDGKSTLIGRLLYDSRGVYEDQMQAVTKASVGRGAGKIDFSLLTDGLRAEREQGITIDVAYRYFATSKRKFIIADTPGHEQYTRNMVTGASTAELAIVLVDARKGLLTQSRRHLAIAALLGLSHVVVAVNKMDLVGYDQQVFDRIEADFRGFLSTSSMTACCIPMSALRGDNVVTQSEKMPWYQGKSLLQYLEQVPVNQRAEHGAFRFPVQRVVRPDPDFRGYAGTIASGSIRPGDALTVSPSGKTSTVAALYTFDGNLEQAHTGDAVTIRLSDDLDISRGDLLGQRDDPPFITKQIEAKLVWLSETPAKIGKRYHIKHATRQDMAQIRRINSELHLETLLQHPTQTLEMNAIGTVEIETARPLAFDLYGVNRTTGSFILIDPVTNATIAAGMIAAPLHQTQRLLPVTLKDRIARQQHSGAIIRLPGRPELAAQLERRLFDRGCTVFSFDEQSPEFLRELIEIGVLVLVTGSALQRFSIETTSGPIDLGSDELESQNNDALVSLERLLEQRKILLAPSKSSADGEGAL